MRRNGCGVGIVLAVLLILWHNHSKFLSMKMREREERMCPQKIALLTDSCADLTPALIRPESHPCGSAADSLRRWGVPGWRGY